MRISLVFLLILSLYSCNQIKPEKPIPAHYLYSIQNNKALEVTKQKGDGISNFYDYEILSGDGLLFKFAYLTEEYPNTMDDGSVERFLIEIPKGLDSISIKDRQFNKFNNFYILNCFSPDCNQGAPTQSGIFKGKKIDNKSWWFEVEVGMISFQDTVFIGKEIRKEI